MILDRINVTPSPGAGVGEDNLCMCKYQGGQRVCLRGETIISRAIVLLLMERIVRIWKKNPTLLLNSVIDGKSLQFPSSSYHSLLLSQLSSLLSGDDPSEVNPSLILHGASLTILSLFVIEVRSSVLNSPCMHYSSRVCVSNEYR